MIYVDTRPAIRSLRKLGEDLSDKNMTRAISRAMNETVLQARTQARAAVKSIYNIPQKNLKGVDVIRSKPQTLVAKLFASATPIPMDAFSPIFHTATQSISVSRKGVQKLKGNKKQTVGQGVSIEVIKGKRETIPYAFMIAGAKPRVFARGQYNSGAKYGFVRRHKRLSAAGNDLPIKPLLSVTVHAAVINKKALQTIKANVDAVFPRALERNISFLLRSGGT